MRCIQVLLLGFWVAASAVTATTDEKVVVLGFDGVDAELTQQWMEEGKLPNLAALRNQGSFSPLRSTLPSQTPVSWSTFATGNLPGRHQIFDFLRRDPKTYRPSFAAFDQQNVPFLLGKWNPHAGALAAFLLATLLGLGLAKLARRRGTALWTIALSIGLINAILGFIAADRLLPKERPLSINRQQGQTLWEAIGAAGKRVRVMQIPVTFPPEPFPNGELLSGLGTPDLSLRIGKPFYFTSDLFFETKAGGEFSVEVVELADNKGIIATEIKGPPNKLFPEGEPYITLPMTLTVSDDRSALKIEVSGNTLSLKPGQWSDWVPLTFPFNPLIKMHGIGRFRLLELDKEVRLYLSPISFDPTQLPPVVDITTPKPFVRDLTADYGLFKTLGWAIDTWSITEGTIDETAFFEDTYFTVDKTQEMLLGSLAETDWDLLIHYFEFPDRVQHVMWRYFDPKHPLYNAEKAAKWGGSILEAYQRMDTIVGETLKRLPKGGKLFVLSDHGFASFRRTMNYNTWLVKNGYMTLTGADDGGKDLEDLFDQGDFFVNVDWSKTKAYACGLGQLYINLEGREGKGIVKPGPEYEALVAELRQALTAYVDPATGEKPVAYVATREEAYGTFDPNVIPDLIPSNSDGYRVGWQDSLGGIAKEINQDNDRIWSGDHCSVYPPLVNGILFANIPLRKDPFMGDLMPTILDLFDVQPQEKLDGQSLLSP